MLQHLSWSRGLKNNFALNLSGLNSLVKDELGMPEIYFVCFLAPLSPKLWNLRSQILKQCTLPQIETDTFKCTRISLAKAYLKTHILNI